VFADEKRHLPRRAQAFYCRSASLRSGLHPSKPTPGLPGAPAYGVRKGSFVSLPRAYPSSRFPPRQRYRRDRTTSPTSRVIGKATPTTEDGDTEEVGGLERQDQQHKSSLKFPGAARRRKHLRDPSAPPATAAAASVGMTEVKDAGNRSGSG
jgi:hypothetical protein